MPFQTTTSRKTNQERRIPFTYPLLVAVSCFLIFSGCGDNFQPLKENTLYNFNISGYLDVSADTQWVRVGTIRESINEPPDPANIKVTLEDLKNGNTVVMDDSLFAADGVLNYWTKMDIRKEQSYRVIAEGDDKKTSQVTVTTPKEFPTVYITISDVDGSEVGANIYIDDDVKLITDLQSVWYVVINPNTNVEQRRIYRFPLRNNLQHTTAFRGAHYAFSNWGRELAQIEQSVGRVDVSVVSRQFFVATGEPEWYENFSFIDDYKYFFE